MLTRFVVYRAVIAWIAGISAGLARGSEINAQTVLMKTARATPETDREPAFGERWGVTTSSSSKHKNFGGRLCVRPRQFNRGAPGGSSEVLRSLSDCRSQNQPRRAATFLKKHGCTQ